VSCLLHPKYSVDPSYHLMGRGVRGLVKIKKPVWIESPMSLFREFEPQGRGV
jgi:hypothetical protein